MAAARVRWRRAWRIIATRHPPIELFERVSADPAVWEALIALEALTNPRLRDEVGDIALVPAEERVTGPGASYVMAAFTHRNPKGSRFSDGSYGVYYAADRLETAIAETIHHFEAFARDAADPPRAEDMRVLVGAVDAAFEDASALAEPERSAILDRHDYRAARAYGARMRAAGVNGIVYPSVRAGGGRCVAAFRPRAVTPPVQERHLQYRWDGARVDRWFDYAEERWIERR